jgi:hypothetical protein
MIVMKWPCAIEIKGKSGILFFWFLILYPRDAQFILNESQNAIVVLYILSSTSYVISVWQFYSLGIEYT